MDCSGPLWHVSFLCIPICTPVFALVFQIMHLRYVYPPPKLFEAQERKTVAAAKIGLLTLCPPLEVGPNQENKARFLAIKTAQAGSLTVLLYLDI